MTYPETNHIRANVKDGVLYYDFPIFDPFKDRFLGVFSSRIGGVSEGCYGTMNLGISRGDDDEKVRENLRRFAAAAGFPAEAGVLSQQTHTTNLRHVTAEDKGKGFFRERGYTDIDGLWTEEKDIPLITCYADCTPLLFFAADQNIAMSVHSGWRGTVAGIGRVAVEKLLSLGCKKEHIYAAMGPSAGPCCYEVDEVTASQFHRNIDPCTAPPEEGKPGKYMANMWLANRILLEKAGLLPDHIAVGGLCTICHNDVFFSHRIQGDARGGLIAVTMLK